MAIRPSPRFRHTLPLVLSLATSVAAWSGEFIEIGDGGLKTVVAESWGVSPKWAGDRWAKNGVLGVQLIHCSSPANVAWPGEQPSFTFQFTNLTDQAVKTNGRVRLIQYELTTPGEDVFAIGMRRVADRGTTPISVSVDGKGWADVTIKPELPAIHGGYALIIELEGQDALFGASVVRTFKPEAKERQFYRLTMDFGDADVLTRLGATANRVGIAYKPTTDPDFEEWYQRETTKNLAQLRDAKLPVCIEFGAGPFSGSTQPMGVERPHLDAKGVMLDGKSDVAWLPSYDEDFKKFVKRFASDWGWPKGPVNAMKLWNEPWNGLSISHWGADDERYREIYTKLCEGVEEVRAETGLKILLGGCDSSSNTYDKLFADGKTDFHKRLDFVSLHYQGNSPESTAKLWRDRKGPDGKPSPALFWDTESWVANSDDRIAGVLAAMYAFGHDRVVGIMAHHFVSTSREFDQHVGGDKTERRRVGQMWSVGAAVGAFQHFVGERTFKNLLFRPGLPFVMEFVGEADAAGKINPEDATLVVIGDLGGVFGFDGMALRTCRSLAEVRAKEELRGKLRNLAADSPERADLEARLAKPMLFQDCTLTIPADAHYALYDFYGNQLPAKDGKIVVPLDARGFYLRGDATPGSHAKLVAAVQAGRIDGISPVAIKARDMIAPVASKPTVQVELTNVLNRPVTAKLQATLGELQIGIPASVTLAPNQTQVVAITVSGGTARPDNRYPLRLVADFGADGTVFHNEDMRVNWVAKRSVAIDGKLDDWKDAIPQTVVFKGQQTVTLTEKAWLPFVPADESVKQGFAIGYLAHDADNFYFAAKVNDTTPHAGAPRYADRSHEDEYFYPEVSYKMTREGERANEFSVRWSGFLQAQKTGKYTLICRSDDGVRMWIGDRQPINDWRGRGAADSVTEMELKAGERLPIRIEYHQGGGDGSMLFAWVPPGGERQTVPTEALFTEAQGDAHGLKAEFFNGTDLKGEPVQRRIDSRIDYPDWTGKPSEANFGSAKMISKEFHWPAGVRRYSYRRWPVLPFGGDFDNLQIAFNVLPDEQKPNYPFPPGTFKSFTTYPTTDYEYALNPVAARFGGGTEVWRLDRPGMPHKHFYPRQPASPEDGPAKGAKLVITHEGATRITECAIPWTEIPAVKAALDAGTPISFSFRVNDDAGVGCMELPRGRSVSNKGSGFRADWQEHWTNEIVFGFEK